MMTQASKKRRSSRQKNNTEALNYDMSYHPLDSVTRPRTATKKLKERLRLKQTESGREDHHDSSDSAPHRHRAKLRSSYESDSSRNRSQHGISCQIDDGASLGSKRRSRHINAPEGDNEPIQSRSKVPKSHKSGDANVSKGSHARRSGRIRNRSSSPIYNSRYHPADEVLRPAAVARSKRLKQERLTEQQAALQSTNIPAAVKLQKSAKEEAIRHDKGSGPLPDLEEQSEDDTGRSGVENTVSQASKFCRKLPVLSVSLTLSRPLRWYLVGMLSTWPNNSYTSC